MFFKIHQSEQLSHTNIALLLALFSSVFYFFINYFFLFSFTAPSDPLQYVLPALQPEDGFPYLDRVMLWLWIRLVGLLPIPLEQVGGVATLLLSSFTLLLLTWYLSKKINVVAGAFFVFFYMASPSILGIASYTYPMQLLTFFLVLTLISMDSSKSLKTSIFLGGFGFILIILSKVQGYTFAILMFAYILYFSKTFKEFIHYTAVGTLGAVVSLLSVLVVISILDDFEVVLSLFENYFSGSAQIQYAGRNAGGFPSFYSYLLEPTAIVSLVGMLFVWFFKQFAFLRLWSAAGLLQLLGLLVIYAITQRGGPVISNYFIDSYVLGLVAFSGILGVLLSNVKFKLSLAIFLIVTIMLMIVFWALESKHNNSVYTPIYLLKSNIAFVLGGIVWIGFILLLLYLTKFKKNMVLLLSILMIGIPSLLVSDRGVKDSKFRQDYNIGYHNISKYISSLANLEEPVWASFKLNRSSVKTGTLGLQRIYRAFYDNTNKEVIFSSDEPLNYKTIVTNRTDLFLKHGLKGVELPVNNDLVNEKILISNIREDEDYGIKLGGIRGNCFVEKTLVDGKGYLNVFPVPSKGNFLLQLDYSGQAPVSLTNRDFRVFLSASTVEFKEAAFVKLYIQYKLSDKWIRKVSVVKKNNDFTALTTIVPKGSSKLSYGWIVSGNNLTKPIRLPNILFAQTKDTLFQKTINAWILKK